MAEGGFEAGCPPLKKVDSLFYGLTCFCCNKLAREA